jgi:hypothetical protein
VAQDHRIENGPEVVGIRDKGEFHAFGEQAVEPAAADQGRVEVAVPWRAPLHGRIGRPDDRFHGGGIDFRDLVLHQFHFGA